MILTVRKKPIEVEAIKWNGTERALKLISKWNPDVSEDRTEIVIPTLEGTMRGPVGCYVIRGVQGEIYPCAAEIFDATYDVVSAFAPFSFFERDNVDP